MFKYIYSYSIIYSIFITPSHNSALLALCDVNPSDNDNDNDNENMFITIDLHIYKIQDARYKYTGSIHGKGVMKPKLMGPKWQWFPP